MPRVGLTGGIGSGKSEVARLLSAHGAVVIDADVLAREVVAAGTPGLQAVVDEFGSGILAAGGGLDRAALAAVVFADRAARERPNAIIHPLVGQRFAELAARAGDAVVVHDVPLLTENNLAGNYDLVLVVEAPPAVRLARLAARGLAESDARARMASQATDEQRRAIADVVIDNSRSLDDLAATVDRIWRERISTLGGGQ